MTDIKVESAPIYVTINGTKYELSRSEAMKLRDALNAELRDHTRQVTTTDLLSPRSPLATFGNPPMLMGVSTKALPGQAMCMNMMESMT